MQQLQNITEMLNMMTLVSSTAQWLLDNRGADFVGDGNFNLFKCSEGSPYLLLMDGEN